MFPVPIMTSTTQPVWDGLRDKTLLVHRCRTCSATYWPFSACRNHDNEPYFANMEWVPASGRGRVHTYSVHLQTFHPAFPAPHIFAIVELEEGPLIPAVLDGFDGLPDGVTVGAEVEADYVELDELTVLRFRPAGGVTA